MDGVADPTVEGEIVRWDIKHGAVIRVYDEAGSVTKRMNTGADFKD